MLGNLCVAAPIFLTTAGDYSVVHLVGGHLVDLELFISKPELHHHCMPPLGGSHHGRPWGGVLTCKAEDVVADLEAKLVVAIARI